MTKHEQAYLTAEQRFLESERVAASTRFVDLPRLGARVRMLEAGQGPPVLFLSGVTTTGMVFAGLAARLHDFRCLLLDRPGTGLSSMPQHRPVDLEAQQRFADRLVVDVLDGLGLERAHLVSTSLGGWYGFRGAAAHPERVDRIVGMGLQVGAPIVRAPWSMRLPPPPARFVPRRPRVPRRLVRRLLRSAGLQQTFDAGRFSDAALDAMVALFRHTETVRNELLHSPRPIDRRGGVAAVEHSAELLARVQAPVHLFWGADDLFGGESSARQFAAKLPDATVEIVEGAGHAPWLDEPERAEAAVRRHFGA